LSDHRFLAPLDDPANVADDVFVVLILGQIPALHEIANSFVDHFPKARALPTCVGMFLAFWDLLDS
jgi:hypothetical protein